MSIELINLYNNMSASANYSTTSTVIAPATPSAAFPAPVVSTLFALTTFNEYKNLVLGLLSLATGSHVTMDITLIIWIHD